MFIEVTSFNGAKRRTINVQQIEQFYSSEQHSGTDVLLCDANTVLQVRETYDEISRRISCVLPEQRDDLHQPVVDAIEALQQTMEAFREDYKFRNRP